MPFRGWGQVSIAICKIWIGATATSFLIFGNGSLENSGSASGLCWSSIRQIVRDATCFAGGLNCCHRVHALLRPRHAFALNFAQLLDCIQCDV